MDSHGAGETRGSLGCQHRLQGPFLPHISPQSGPDLTQRPLGAVALEKAPGAGREQGRSLQMRVLEQQGNQDASQDNAGHVPPRHRGPCQPQDVKALDFFLSGKRQK